jgi:hypothetical protein
MRAHSGQARANRNPCNSFELHQVHCGNVAIGCGDKREQMQIRPEKGGAMLAEKDDQAGDGQNYDQEVNAKVSGTVHQGLGIVA